MDADICLVLVTAPPSEAPGLARIVVEEGLAACANLIPAVTSIYRWKGEVEEDREALVVLKTARGTVSRLQARIEALHSYDVPEFLVLPVESGLPPYLAWVAAESGGRA